MKESEWNLLRNVDEHLKGVWTTVMEDWKMGLVTTDSKKRSIALVTRDCTECDTRVRMGVLINPISPGRPAGERAYCATCKKVTVSPILEVRGLGFVDGN